MKAEFTLTNHEQVEHEGTRVEACKNIQDLTADLLVQAGTNSNYVEYELVIDTADVLDVLDAMTVRDLYIRPGDHFDEYEFYSWEPCDKMGLYYANSFVVPARADRTFLAVSAQEVEAYSNPLCYVALGFEYAQGARVFQQFIGIVADPAIQLDAVRCVYGTDEGMTVTSQGFSRPLPAADGRQFIECVRSWFAESYVM